MTIECGFADMNGTRLYYEVAGSGPALVLTHGFVIDRRLWEDQFEAFAQHYQVIRYDLRGFGRSALPSDVYSHVEDLKALLDYLGIARAHIVGQSMGGGVAIDFALTHPEVTRTLILVDSILGGYWTDEFGHTFEAVNQKAATAGGKAANETLLDHPIFNPTRDYPAVLGRVFEMIRENSGWHWVNQDPLVPIEPPARQRLHEITAPILVILGERDMPYFHEIAAILQQDVRHARVVVIPGVGHMPNMEAPELFNTTVLSFLESVRESIPPDTTADKPES